MMQQHRVEESDMRARPYRQSCIDSIAPRFKVSGLKRDDKTRDVGPKSAKIDLSRFIVNRATA